MKAGGTDTKAPQTFHMAKKMQVNKRAKANIFQHEEHLKNLASMHSRIQQVGSKQDRQKNPNDPLANPVFFFKKDEKEKKQSLIDYAKKIVLIFYLLL